MRDLTGITDFVNFEKIRRRFSDVVEDFDLATNSTPGTVQVDPVYMVYQLNPTIPELQVEGPTFERSVSFNTQTQTLSGSSNAIIPSVLLDTDGVKRVLRAQITIQNLTGTTITVTGRVSRRDVLAGPGIFAAQINAGIQSTYGHSVLAPIGATPEGFDTNIGTIEGITFGENIFLIFDIEPDTSFSGDVEITEQYYIERRIE